MRHLIAPALLAAFSPIAALTASAEEKEPTPSITVVGTGESHAKPDQAHIQVGVVTQAASASQAMQANNGAMKKLFELLAERDIAEKDIQTTGFNVSPQYQHDPAGKRPPAIVGYEARNQVQVKVRKLASLGELLDELVREGANHVSGISFSVADSQGILDDARRKALADARRKAQLYAAAADVKLGSLLQLEEGSTPAFAPRYMARQAAAEAVPIAAGEQQFTVSVTATYRIE